MSGVELVASRLREARADRGYVQKEAAALLGIPLSTLARYEQGATDVTGDVLIRMAQCYGVTADWMLGLSSFKTTSQGTGACAHCVPILNAYVQMNESSRGALIEVANALVYRDCTINNNDISQSGDGNNSIVVGDKASVVNCSGNATVNINHDCCQEGEGRE